MRYLNNYKTCFCFGYMYHPLPVCPWEGSTCALVVTWGSPEPVMIGSQLEHDEGFGYMYHPLPVCPWEGSISALVVTWGSPEPVMIGSQYSTIALCSTWHLATQDYCRVKRGCCCCCPGKTLVLPLPVYEFCRNFIEIWTFFHKN